MDSAIDLFLDDDDISPDIQELEDGEISEDAEVDIEPDEDGGFDPLSSQDRAALL